MIKKADFGLPFFMMKIKVKTLKRKLVTFCVFLLGVVFQVNAAVVQDKNGLEINEQDIDVLLEKGTPAAQLQLIENKENFKTKIKEVYLMKAIADQAKKEGLADTPEHKARLQALLDQFYFRIKLNSLRTENLPDFESLARMRYKANQQDYYYPEQVDIAHILIDKKKRPKEQALKLADDITAKLRNGEDFAKLAVENSDDTTVQQNKGELGFYPRGVMPNQFDQVAFSLKEGEISDPVETKYGYHIIKLNKHEAKKNKTYEEARKEIIYQIKTEYVQNRIDSYYDQMQKENDMQFNEDELDRYSERKLKEIKMEADAKK